MEKEELYKLIENPKLIDEHGISLLSNLINRYPYFYPARVLELIGQKAAKSAEFNQKLKQTAALSPNRYNLFLTLNPATSKIISSKLLDVTPIETQVSSQPERPTAGATFQLDESQRVAVLDELKEDVTITPETPQSYDVELLELGDPSEPRHHKTDEEAYLDPQLYTLEIPVGFNNSDPLAEAGFGRFNRDDAPVIPAVTTEKQPSSDDKELAQKIEEKDKPVDQAILIDTFIETNPRIIPRQRPEELPEVQEDISLDSIRDPDDAISEPLAAIHIAQGRNSKAILIYEKLCLKFPEKRVYFAGQIEKLKNQPDK